MGLTVQSWSDQYTMHCEAEQHSQRGRRTGLQGLQHVALNCRLPAIISRAPEMHWSQRLVSGAPAVGSAVSSNYSGEMKGNPAAKLSKAAALVDQTAETKMAATLTWATVLLMATREHSRHFPCLRSCRCRSIKINALSQVGTGMCIALIIYMHIFV